MSLLFRLDSGTGTALVFSGSQKTLPNGIYLWERFFGDNPIGAGFRWPSILIQLVVDTFLVPFSRSPETPATDRPLGQALDQALSR